MNRLLGIGFEFAGHWLLEDSKLKCELIRHSQQKNILYAFICDGEVKYVGKTVRTLAERMAGYKNPDEKQTTNIKNHRRIRELLARGVTAEVFALPDNGLMHYGPFHLNLAAALEDDIIRVMNPEWNGGVTKSVPSDSLILSVEQPDVKKESELAPVILPVDTFSFTLQPTYYKTGFFNVGVSAQKFLGADGETIELYLGNVTEPILGTINRRANQNGTPRIMGGTELRDWFNATAPVMAIIIVEVLSPTAIRLRLEKV